MSAKLRLLLQYLFAAGALLVLLLLVDVRSLGSTIAQADRRLLVAGVGILSLAFLLNTHKWGFLIRIRGVRVRYRELVHLNLVAALYSNVLPGQLAGEGAKVYKLMRKQSDRPVLVASVVLDRLTGLWGVIALGIVGGFLAASNSGSALWVLVSSLVVLGVTWPAFGFIVSRAGHPTLPREDAGRAAIIVNQMWRVMSAVNEYRAHRRALAVAVAEACFIQTLLTANALVFAQALGVSVDFPTIAWVFAATSVVQLLPVTVGGLGTREGSFVYLLGLNGVAAHDALALSLLVFAGNLAFALVGGLVELAPRRKSGDAPNTRQYIE